MEILLIECDTMNQCVARLTEEKGREIIDTIELEEHQHSPYKTCHHTAKVQDEADVAIGFSNPNLLLSLLDEDSELSLVTVTTGEKEKPIQELEQLSERMPVFFSANMGYDVHTLTKILETAILLLHDYDIELAEAHHSKEVDAPSGTLVKLYDITKELHENVMPVYNRHERTEKREKDEVDIHSIRGGTIVGEHDVLFASANETVIISYKTQSKDIFTNGVITTTEKLDTESNGFYAFDNLQNDLKRF